MHELNEDILDKEIRLIGAEGQQLGIMSSQEALKIADEQGLDLVKISPQAVPPVCKLMNYGKFRFEQSKKEKEARKNQHVVEVKEIRMSPGIDVGDFNTKPGAKSLRLLADGYGFDNVKLIGIAEGEAGGTFHFYKGGMGSRRIDYIFATPEFSLISAKIVRTSYDGEYPSDHYPLSVRLALD